MALKSERFHLTGNWFFRFFAFFGGFISSVAYSRYPFGPLRQDEVMQITYLSSYAPYFYVWFTWCELILGICISLPHKFWGNFRWIVFIPFIGSYLIFIYYFPFFVFFLIFVGMYVWDCYDAGLMWNSKASAWLKKGKH